MSKTTILVTILFGTSLLCGQTGTYKDVALIINTNSSISDSIGMYFALARSIPVKNIIRVTAPDTEEIDDVHFEDLRHQIESYLTTNGMADSINYIVTTKGVPLKVHRGSAGSCSSVESDLTLILGPYARYIGGSGSIPSPYYGQTGDFLRSVYRIYLVTRLDGYTYGDVKGIIDRTSPIGSGVPQGAQFVFDIDPLWNSIVPSLNENMSVISHTLAGRGFTTYLDSTTTYLTGQANVIGYTSWGSNDHNASLHGIVNNTWARGALAETYVSTSGRSFSTPPEYGQSLIADLIAEGITAAKGYVYEPYASAVADVSVLFDRYVSGYTIAESYYAASPYLSWMDVIIGDPKFRLTTSRLPADYDPSIYAGQGDALPVEITDFSAVPTGTTVKLLWNTATEVNNFGFEVVRKAVSNRVSEGSGSSPNSQWAIGNSQWSNVGFVKGVGTSSTPREYSFTDKGLAPGFYAYRIQQTDRDGSFKYSKEIQVAVSSAPLTFLLSQNYPNPFNPTTTIEFTIPQDGRVVLKVCDITGREVATLVDENRKAGEYQKVVFDASRYSSGVYFAVLQSEGKQLLKKMLLLK